MKGLGTFGLLGLVAGSFACVASPGWAVELDEAFLRIEINASDGDVGLHGKFDGEPSVSMMVTGPSGLSREGVLFVVKGSLRNQGLTENFFESAEPTCGTQPLGVFLARFPAGPYAFRGQTLAGEILEGEAVLSHALPAAPDVSLFDGSAIAQGDPVVISWVGGTNLGACHDPSLVDNGTIPDPATVTVDGWEVTVEPDVEDGVLEGLGLPRNVFTVQLVAGQLSVTVPPEYLQAYVTAGIVAFKFEVGARAGRNQTFSEGGFEIIVP